MKNTFGNVISVTLFGESHGPAVGVVIDGLPSGITIDREYIAHRLNRRKPYGKIGTERREPDEFQIISGVFEGHTTGTPLCVMIENKDIDSRPYEEVNGVVRPSHADLTGFYKYGEYRDYRGGGHFSGRLTAPIVVAGAIISRCLEYKGIYIGTHIKQCFNVSDREFSYDGETLEADIRYLSQKEFPVLDSEASLKMISAIETAGEEGDSVGGILETAIIGLPGGVGEPWFDTVEGMLSHGIFSIPAVKGIEFGAGFGVASMKGSEANDSFRYDGDRIITKTNNNGGINGGITNGMPVVFRTAIKPTPSISKEQDTVDVKRGRNVKTIVSGRHDPAIVHRASPVVDAVTAITVADLLVTAFGGNFLR